MKKLIVLILSGIFISGCAIKKEGVYIGATSKFSSIDLKKCRTKKCPDEVILIGTVSAYRSASKDTLKEYNEYLKSAKKFLGDSPVTLTLEDYKKSIKGWTMLQTFKIPLVAASYKSIFVPMDNQEKINYVSTAEAALVQGTGDLVSARSNSDGLFFLDQLLCDRKHEFSNCKKKYYRGGYDAGSGMQLNQDLTVKENGKRINTETYELFESN